MAYWSATQLAEHIPQLTYGRDIVTATSVPVSATQFDKMIAITSAQADAAACRGGWAVPVSSTATAFLQMQDVVKHGALALLYDRLPDAKKAQEYRAAYEAMLTELEEGDLVLIGGSPAAGGSTLPRGGSGNDLGPYSTGAGGVGSAWF